MLVLMLITIILRSSVVIAYSNKLFTITIQINTKNDICFKNGQNLNPNESDPNDYGNPFGVTSSLDTNFIKKTKLVEKDPFITFHDDIYQFLFGENYGVKQNINNNNLSEPEARNLLHFPTGRALRKAELFNGKSSVHFPITELMYPGYCVLNVTNDYMQTAVDAFAIFVKGNAADVKRLPAEYVLNSARMISMMKISHEKLTATWSVVKGSKDPIEVSYKTLERYRPLFKYLGGNDMAKLNLTDHRILNFIGTHPNLNRHQVGLVASKYIKLNKKWSEPKYLNLMNNLLCGVPMIFMRDVLENAYLQLSHQVFYHTRACDPLQRRFYLALMTRTQALGKSYSWSAQDVSRLGLLLAEVEGEDLGSIKPEAMAGLTAQVATEMRPENLLYLSDVQLGYIGEKPFNILSRKIKIYKDRHLSGAWKQVPIFCIVFLNNIVIKLYTLFLNE